jgi:DNA-binding NtrC family response regulator
MARGVKQSEHIGEISMQEARPGIRVLVADDDHVIATTLSQILRLNGYQTETVNSGEAAIAAALIHRPDVLISDVVMGGISGIEAAARITEIHPACIVVLISGQANTVHWLGQSRDTASPFEILLKPIHPAALLERIAASIAMRQPVEQLAAQRAASAC